MRHRGQRLVRGIVALISFALAWWLLDTTGNWPNRQSFAQFLLLFLCVIAIDRILSAAIDLTVIALGREHAPRDT